MIYQYIINLIGSVPEGMEDAVYVFSCIILFFLLAQIFAFLHSLFKGV